MRITVPKDIDSGLKVLPEGVCTAVIDRVMIGKSKAGKPKLTVRFVCTSELFTDGSDTSIGEKILDTYSLEPQALWRLNDLYKQATGSSLPHGDYSPEEFEDMIESQLRGTEWRLVLEQDSTDTGEIRTRVSEARFGSS